MIAVNRNGIPFNLFFLQEKREQQAESAIKREAKRLKAYKPPKEDAVKKDEPEKKKAKSDLNLDALKAKVKAASSSKKVKKNKVKWNWQQCDQKIFKPVFFGCQIKPCIDVKIFFPILCLFLKIAYQIFVAFSIIAY